MADTHDPSHSPHDPHDSQHEGHHEGEPIDFDVAPEGGNPLSELGLGDSTGAHDLHASSDDFDFTEPSNFAFPGGHEGSIDSGLFEPQMHDASAHEGHVGTPFDAEHAETTQFDGGHFDADFAGGHFGEHPGGTTEMPDFGAEAFHAGDGIPEAEAAEVAVAEAEVAEEEEASPKVRRPLPKWVSTLEWSLIGGIPLIAVVFNIIAIRSFSAKSIDLGWHISYIVLLLLIPYALWRSKERWISPRITASYTVMLAVATACLLSGVWMLGMELSGYGWQIKVKKVHLPSPLPASSVMIEDLSGVAKPQA